jgi:hypothetical protein
MSPTLTTADLPAAFRPDPVRDAARKATRAPIRLARTHCAHRIPLRDCDECSPLPVPRVPRHT